MSNILVKENDQFFVVGHNIFLSYSLSGLKASAARSVESFASPERIAALKAMISDGSYNMDIPEPYFSIFIKAIPSFPTRRLSAGIITL